MMRPDEFADLRYINFKMGNSPGLDAAPGFAGAALSTVFANLGAAYGMARAGAGIAGMGQRKPQLIIKCLLPVIMASILGIYGMIVSVILLKNIDVENYSWYLGYKHLGSGLSCGLSSLAAGYAIGIVGDVGARAIAQQDKLFIGMLLSLIFAEAIGLYGMILAIVMATSK